MIEELDNIKATCLEKWCNKEIDFDERLRKFNDDFECWLNQIPKENQTTVLTLIKNLEYYSHRTTNFWLKKLHSELIKKPNISDENTIYVFIKSKYGKTNSSNDYWTEYKAINKINKNICIENMDLLDEDDWQYIQNIVFIDDFSGSGKSFIDELEKHPKRYCNKNVYFITINTMVFAVNKINEYCEQKHINIVLLSAFNQEKTFERNLFEDNEVCKEEIKSMSKGFSIPENQSLGFNEGEALVVFYNNTPNNTLGFIRYDTKQYKSIFPRRDDKVPIWMKMKKQKMQRNKANYSNKKQGG